jgi:predicted O-linked N-acetylglucosamine transferase (SPINDLY family)
MGEATTALPAHKHRGRRAAGASRTVNAGFIHHQAGRLEQAEALYREALERNPNHGKALYLLGVVAYEQGKSQSAIELIERALPELHDLPEVHLDLGNALREAGRLTEAEGSYRRALELAPDFGMAHANLALTLNDQGLFEAGLNSSWRAIELIPDFPGAHVNCAAALLGLERFAEAEAPLRRAVELTPEKAEAHSDLGELLAKIDRCDEAEMSFRRAVAINQDFAPAYLGLGNLLRAQGNLSDAIACFERAVAVDPDNARVLAAWFRERQHICDWSGYDWGEARARRAIEAQPSLGTAFTLITLSSTPGQQLACARRVAGAFNVPESAVLPCPRPRPRDRIRLGYLSADFHQHATAILIAGLIEHHDRRGFEVVGYSCGSDDGSAMRARLTTSFDRFVDLSKIPHRQAAELIHADGVDILIDLKGFTRYCRTAILAHRPAPIQVNYLGYPSTMGADFIDYIIVDPFVVPPDQQSHFSERLVHLPDCYQCNDETRAVAERTPLRFECGLPEEGVVFCCFNASYKITPAFFDIWMRLLSAVPGSVLWLLDANPWAKVNLAREAAARGIRDERLVFAPRQLSPKHLARHRLADLFLDTLPVNAHTTASDALWAGLPLLTCVGNTFAGRVAGSLLRAIGLGELVTTSLEEYEALALRLAQEPETLAGLRARLAQNRLTHPLFDTVRSTGNLEAAYRRMWENWRAGRPPAAFSVSPSADFER